MTTQLIRVGLYARVSTEDQAERETIQNQVHLGRTLTPALGMVIVEEYLDDGVSGTIPLDKRPAGVRLLADARAHKFDQVIFARVDRFGRKALIILQAAETLTDEIGVPVRSLTEPFDTSTPIGKFILGILAMVAGLGRDSILLTTQEGRMRKAREGKWTGGHAPLGYRVVGDKTDRHLEEDAEEASLVREIFRLYVEDRLSANRIADLFNARGVPTHSTRRGYRTRWMKSPERWNHNRILALLRSGRYIGTRVYGRQGRTGHISQDVPALIDRAVWEEAQRLRPANKLLATRNGKRPYILRGLIRCGVCGRAYVGGTTNSGKHAYYRCNDAHCPSPGMSAPLLEELVWRDIQAIRDQPDTVLSKLAQETEPGDDPATVAAEGDTLRAAMARIGDERQTILYQLRKGNITEAEAETQLTLTARERDQLQARLTALDLRAQSARYRQDRIRAAETVLGDILKGLEAKDPDIRRAVVSSLVEGITIGGVAGKPKATITYVFGIETPIEDTTSQRSIDNVRFSRNLTVLSLRTWADGRGIPYNTAWYRVRAGQLASFKIGKLWYVLPETIPSHQVPIK